MAQQELADGNYSWEQLKMMRIKFLSEYGMYGTILSAVPLITISKGFEKDLIRPKTIY